MRTWMGQFGVDPILWNASGCATWLQVLNSFQEGACNAPLLMKTGTSFDSARLAMHPPNFFKKDLANHLNMKEVSINNTNK